LTEKLIRHNEKLNILMQASARVPSAPAHCAQARECERAFVREMNASSASCTKNGHICTKIEKHFAALPRG
jgi:hypothetical protein